MDKRRKKRIKVHQLARVSGKMGVMNNVSREGLQVSTALLPDNRKVDIIFEALGEEIKVKGIIQWFRRKTSLQSLHELGVIVKEAPPQFQQYVESLDNI